MGRVLVLSVVLATVVGFVSLVRGQTSEPEIKPLTQEEKIFCGKRSLLENSEYTPFTDKDARCGKYFFIMLDDPDGQLRIIYAYDVDEHHRFVVGKRLEQVQVTIDPARKKPNVIHKAAEPRDMSIIRISPEEYEQSPCLPKPSTVLEKPYWNINFLVVTALP